MSINLSIDGAMMVHQYTPNLAYKPMPYQGQETLTQFTEGDLHGNTIRLIESLVFYGVIDTTVPGSSYDCYEDLLKYYQRALDAPEDERNNRRLVNLIETGITIKNKKLLARLIGDVLADRTGNDLFSLTLINKLLENDANLRILMSNHDLYFVIVMLGADSFEEVERRTAAMNAETGFFMNNSQGISFMQLLDSVRRGEVSFERLQAMTTRYLSTLILLDYSMDEQGDFKLYSHAPVSLGGLRALSEQFGVTYPGDTCSDEEKIKFINAINVAFRASLQFGDGALIKQIFNIDSPAFETVWAREFGHNFIPVSHRTTNVYGHDSSLKRNGMRLPNGVRVVQLDTAQGKGRLYATGEATTYANHDDISPIASPEFGTDGVAFDHTLEAIKRWLPGYCRTQFEKLRGDHTAIFDKRGLLSYKIQNINEQRAHADGLHHAMLTSELAKVRHELDVVVSIQAGNVIDETAFQAYVNSLIEEISVKREAPLFVSTLPVKKQREHVAKSLFNMKPVPLKKMLAKSVEAAELLVMAVDAHASTHQTAQVMEQYSKSDDLMIQMMIRVAKTKQAASLPQSSSPISVIHEVSVDPEQGTLPPVVDTLEDKAKRAMERRRAAKRANVENTSSPTEPTVMPLQPSVENSTQTEALKREEAARKAVQKTAHSRRFAREEHFDERLNQDAKKREMIHAINLRAEVIIKSFDAFLKNTQYSFPHQSLNGLRSEMNEHNKAFELKHTYFRGKQYPYREIDLPKYKQRSHATFAKYQDALHEPMASHRVVFQAVFQAFQSMLALLESAVNWMMNRTGKERFFNKAITITELDEHIEQFKQSLDDLEHELRRGLQSNGPQGAM